MALRRLTIADVGADATHAFRSMMEVLSGRMSCAWELVESIDEADVVVTGNPEQLDHPAPLKGKRIVAIVEKADVRLRAHTPYVLTHPFRVMQVLAILDEIADDFKHPELRIVRNPQADQWEFAESVRALVAGPVKSAWYRTRTTDGAGIIITGNLHNCACDATVFEQVRYGTTGLSALTPTSVQSVPARYVKRPLVELLWQNAYHASVALAPWLDPNGLYRVGRWPDFGTIPPTRQHLQLVAAMSRRALSRAQLGRVVEASPGEIDRLLNALSLCNLLAVETAVPVAAKSASPLPGFLRSMLGSLRRSLKLAY